MTTRFLRIVALLAVSALVPIASELGAETGEADFPPPAHQVLLLGTFHFEDAGLDEFKPEVSVDVRSEERQRELEQVLDVLERFRPTKVAVEVLPERQSELDARYAELLRGALELPANEVYQLGFRLAQRLGHQRVYAIDAGRRFYQPWVDPEQYALAHGQGELVTSPWYQRYEELWKREDRLKAERSLGETLLALNDPERIRLGHGIYLVGTFFAGVGEEYPGVDSKIAWYNRNLRIFANLQRITEADAERILVVIGHGHLPILRHAVVHSPEYELVEVASLLDVPAPEVPAVDVASLLGANTYELEHDAGGLGGPGLDLLLEEASKSQFVLLGEPHNTDQVNELTALLVELLAERLGFGHLVTEQDAAIMDLFAAPGVRGDLEAIRDSARRHAPALHFRTDAELALYASAGRHLDTARPLWGVDRVLDAETGLLALRDALEAEADRALVESVLEEARRHQGSERSDRYISSSNASIDRLWKQLDPSPGSVAAELLEALRVSREDLMAYRTDHPPGDPWGYLANLRREELMKSRFRSHYRRAVAGGESQPRALVKMGHWHVVRGFNRGRVSSLGDFLVDVARLNGLGALSINVQPVNEPGRHWSALDSPGWDVFASVADPASWRLVDLRPLRGHVFSGALPVDEDIRDVIFGFDLLLLLGGTDRGVVTWEGSSRQRP